MLVIFAAVAMATGSASETAVHAHACQSLAGRLDDATFESIEAKTIESKGDMPAYCRIKGTIKPSIGFEMRLPLSGWNGKFYQAGCGGYCGIINPDVPGFANGIAEATRRGYAAIHTDSGHQRASANDASWALGNRAALELYAHRWIPLAYAAGTAIVTTYYGQAPRYRYLVGCSNGGRVGLVAAQRYPTLFNGIIIGCPPADFTQVGSAFGAWKLRTNRDGQAPILGPDFARKLPFLIEALNGQCDGLDGKVDGLIARPSSCKINYARIRTCPANEGGTSSPADCLTAEEKQVVRQWHEGPKDSRGRKLIGGMPVGSEDEWRVWYLAEPSNAAGTQMADGFTRYIVADPQYPGFSAKNFDFDRDPQRLARDFALLNAKDTDLSAFRAAGGKIIMWHGMADPLVVPWQTISYYERVMKRMGGRAKVQKFFRFFEAPGLGHCWILPSRSAPEEFDPLVAIEDWVEHGKAPDQILASPSKRQGSGLTVTKIRYQPYPLPPLVGQ